MTHLTIYVILFFRLFFNGHETPSEPKLVWSDEFNTNGAPDSLNWGYDIGIGHNGWGNHELQYYTDSRENAFVQDGKLIIVAKKKEGQWTSARLKTQKKKNWTYGRIVFSARLPQGKGTWPALWMLGEGVSTVGWPTCGEIDIMEHVGRNPAVVQSVVHTLASHGDTPNKKSTSVMTFDSEFHTYEAQWTKDQIDFLVDGVSYYTYRPEERNKENWPFDAPFFIIMNIAIGGGLGGDVDPNLNFAQMEVDYVRVYALEK